ncbi:hypothetical protein [Hymenobacter profundi]|uniref:Uncharacterized protein n=1 Tax=Hymenobacter profundi TaxID=1982110 RepID=A0ABS6WWZ2_9BACT|nr:hypothetical protein [Hymenobacter profundi]MBW3127274.1 hypothetical protein [Hymenobacter profundi]
MPDPSESPQLRIEQAPQDDTEAAQLAQLAHLLYTTDAPPDVRDLAPAVRELFPEPAYQVGCGSSHIWLHRTADHQRLALIR